MYISLMLQLSKKQNITTPLKLQNSFLKTCAYSVYRKDRNLHGVDVMLRVHKGIKHMPITDWITTRSQFGQLVCKITFHYVAN